MAESKSGRGRQDGGGVSWRAPELTTETQARPARTDPRYHSVRVYLTIRFTVGVIGLLLPFVVVFGERWLGLGPQIGYRHSLSAYYHSGMRDVFVSGLVVIAVGLFVYKLGQWSWDNILSVVAGIGALATAFIPTGIPPRLLDLYAIPTELLDRYPGLDLEADYVAHLPHAAYSDHPYRPPEVWDLFGAGLTGTLHFVGAVVYIVPLAVLAFLFAWREWGRSKTERTGGATHLPPTLRSALHIGAGVVTVGGIVIAGGKALDFWSSWDHATLIGEFVATLGFTFSWFLKGFEPDILRGQDPTSLESTPQPTDENLTQT